MRLLKEPFSVVRSFINTNYTRLEKYPNYCYGNESHTYLFIDIYYVTDSILEQFIHFGIIEILITAKIGRFRSNSLSAITLVMISVTL